MKEVWIDQAIGWNDKRKQEFIIKKRTGQKLKKHVKGNFKLNF